MNMRSSLLAFVAMASMAETMNNLAAISENDSIIPKYSGPVLYKPKKMTPKQVHRRKVAKNNRRNR